jgi:hypothetical protein
VNTFELIGLAEKKSSVTACDESIAYAELHPDPIEAWAACERGDWMLWLAEHAGVDRQQIARATADIAELALSRHWPVGSKDRRPHEAVATLRRWIAGEATDEGLRLASEAARAASWAASLAAADAAAQSAARAAWAAARAAEAAAWAAAWAAARAVADAVDVADAAADAARIDSLRESAEIVRRYLSIEDAIAAIGGAK